MSKNQAHHGGAWKVAYADFVTAMMALFMVLWICAQDKKILLATSRYFQSPFRSPLHANSGVMPYEKTTNQSHEKGKDDDSTGQNAPSDSNKHIELSFLNSVAADFYRLLNIEQDLEESRSNHERGRGGEADIPELVGVRRRDHNGQQDGGKGRAQYERDRCRYYTREEQSDRHARKKQADSECHHGGGKQGRKDRAAEVSALE